jgi:hypothetical protein
MDGRHIENRTLGELAAMSDTLHVARQQLLGTSTDAAVRKVIDVLDSIIQGTPFFRSAEVTDAVAWKPKRKRG